MKNKRFLRAMGEIDDRLLERYEKIEQNLPRKKAYKSVWIKYASLAACLCILFSAVFWMQRERGFGGDTPAIVGSNSETYTQAGTIGGVNERPTQAGTVGGGDDGGDIGGMITSYKVIRPDTLKSFVENEAENYRYYMDVDLLNIFDASFSQLSFYAKRSADSSPALYRYCFDESRPTADTSCFEVTVGGMTEEEFKQDKYVNIMPLETALEYEHFDESLINNGLGIGDTYVQIGKAYYYFRPGETSRGIERIIFFVNNRIIFFSFNFDPFDLSMCYPEGDMMDNLSHLSTAPAQIDALIARWESAFPRMSEADMTELIAKIPSDHYESYPNKHGCPISATLYKNGEAIELDVNDPRIIRLVNFFNDSLYQKSLAYTLYNISTEYLAAKVCNEAFRLELKYVPYGEMPLLKAAVDTSFADTMVILNSGYGFVLLNDNENTYRGYLPYGGNYDWLNLFGF